MTEGDDNELFVVSSDNFLGLSDEDIEGAVASVLHDFDEVDATNLVRYFHHAFQHGSMFSSGALTRKDRALIDLVEHAFERFTDADARDKSISLDVAFGLARGKGRPAESHDERDIMIAARVVKVMRNGEKKAVEEVCRMPDVTVGQKSVEAAYTKYRTVLDPMSDRDIADISGLEPSP